MGLRGVGRDVDFLTGPEIADVMENIATRGENANILRLVLTNTSVQAGAPAPISDDVGTIEIPPTFSFDGNFTRERYGKAAVHPNIVLQSDRIDLLLDNNQTESQKALSFISALEFDLGLSAVQGMSDTQVTSRNQPDLDKFREYPESLFNNASLLNNAKETFVFDAVENSEDATEAFTSYQ